MEFRWRDDPANDRLFLLDEAGKTVGLVHLKGTVFIWRVYDAQDNIVTSGAGLDEMQAKRECRKAAEGIHGA